MNSSIVCMNPRRTWLCSMVKSCLGSLRRGCGPPFDFEVLSECMGSALCGAPTPLLTKLYAEIHPGSHRLTCKEELEYAIAGMMEHQRDPVQVLMDLMQLLPKFYLSKLVRKLAHFVCKAHSSECISNKRGGLYNGRDHTPCFLLIYFGSSPFDHLLRWHYLTWGSFVRMGERHHAKVYTTDAYVASELLQCDASFPWLLVPSPAKVLPKIHRSSPSLRVMDYSILDVDLDSILFSHDLQSNGSISAPRQRLFSALYTTLPLDERQRLVSSVISMGNTEPMAVDDDMALFILYSFRKHSGSTDISHLLSEEFLPGVTPSPGGTLSPGGTPSPGVTPPHDDVLEKEEAYRKIVYDAIRYIKQHGDLCTWGIRVMSLYFEVLNAVCVPRCPTRRLKMLGHGIAKSVCRYFGSSNRCSFHSKRQLLRPTVPHLQCASRLVIGRFDQVSLEFVHTLHSLQRSVFAASEAAKIHLDPYLPRDIASIVGEYCIPPDCIRIPRPNDLSVPLPSLPGTIFSAQGKLLESRRQQQHAQKKPGRDQPAGRDQPGCRKRRPSRDRAPARHTTKRRVVV